MSESRIAFGGNVSELLMNVYLDGMATGLSSGLLANMGPLTGEQSDAIADEFMEGVMAKPEAVEAIHDAIRQRMTEAVRAAQDGGEVVVTGPDADRLIAKFKGGAK